MKLLQEDHKWWVNMNRRARPNFSNIADKNKSRNNLTTVSHFEKSVYRNKDFYNYIVAKDCHITKLFFYLDSMAIKSFIMTLHIYGMSGDVHTYNFEIKNVGTKNHLLVPIELFEGDRLRFDIQKIDSVYESIADFGIGFILDFGK